MNEEVRVLTFFKDPSKYMQVHISHDCKKVVVVNDDENFMVQLRAESALQKNLPQLKNKIVRFIKSMDENDSEFLFVACYEYDDEIEIQTSDNSHSMISIPRVVEPEVIQIHDLNVKELLNDKKQLIKHVRMLSLRDDDAVYDHCDFIKPT